MSDEGFIKFHQETRARSRQFRATEQGRVMIENGLKILDRAKDWAYSDGADCFKCGGQGQVYYAPAHGMPCGECGGSGKYSEAQG